MTTRLQRYIMPAYLLLFTSYCLLLQSLSGAFSLDHGLMPDEGAHVVNSLLILDFLSSSTFPDFLKFGIGYYEHFPRVSIGHWPPFFYVLQGMVLAVFGRGNAPLVVTQAAIGGLAAALPAVVVHKRQGLFIGLLAGFTVLSSPMILYLLNAVMLDTFMGLLIFLVSLAWAQYARTPSWTWAMAFALSASCAILTKANAFGLALLPVLYCAMQQRLDILRRWRTWAAALVVGACTIPWYLLTYALSADGFVAPWGVGHTLLALRYYSLKSLFTLGVIGVAAFLVGGFTIARNATERQDETLVALLASALALLFFEMVVPTSLESRYLIIIVPVAVVIAAHGVKALVHWMATHGPRAIGSRGQTALVAAVLAINAVMLFQMPPVFTYHMGTMAQRVLVAPNDNPLVLVAGCPRAEGAAIAAFALRDTGRIHYIIRGSKALATDNFMGTAYKPCFSTIEDVGQWIETSRIGWIILDSSPESLGWAHDRQVWDYLRQHPQGWVQELELPNTNGGTTFLYAKQVLPSPSDIATVLQRVAPKKIMRKE